MINRSAESMGILVYGSVISGDLVLLSILFLKYLDDYEKELQSMSKSSSWEIKELRSSPSDEDSPL
jgi:hypothetical protein